MRALTGVKRDLHVDITHDALGEDRDGQPMYLAALWPAPAEVQASRCATCCIDPPIPAIVGAVTIPSTPMNCTPQQARIDIAAAHRLAAKAEQQYDSRRGEAALHFASLERALAADDAAFAEPARSPAAA